MTLETWKMLRTRVVLATICFTTVLTLMVGDRIAQPQTSHVPYITWRLERPQS